MIQLKNIKVFRVQGEMEGFEANLYWQGKKVGTASQIGHGSPNRVDLDDEALRPKLGAWAQSQSKESLEGETPGMALEFHIDDLVTEFLKQKEEKRLVAFCNKQKAKFELRGLNTIRINTFSSITCIGVSPRMSNEKAMEEYKLRNPKVEVINWQVV